MAFGAPFMRVVLVQSRRTQEEIFYGGIPYLLKEYVGNEVGLVCTVIVRAGSTKE